MASSLNVRPVACISEWHSNLETLTNLQHRSANNQQNTVCTTLVYIALEEKKSILAASHLITMCIQQNRTCIYTMFDMFHYMVQYLHF